MAEQQHSPLPWRVDYRGICGGNSCGCGLGFRRIAVIKVTSAYPNAELEAENAANAAFIVRACNSHYELLAVRDAAMALYLAGRWDCAAVGGSAAAAMWERLRDALGLPHGTATARGIGSQGGV